MLLQLILTTFLVSTVLLSIQQVLSLLSSNQILPLVVGLAGSFLSQFSMFFPPAAARLIIWGYTESSDSWPWTGTGPPDHRYYEVPFDWTGLLLFAVFSAVVYVICRAIALRRKCEICCFDVYRRRT